MSKFKRFGGGPFLSFRGGGANHLSTALPLDFAFSPRLNSQNSFIAAYCLVKNAYCYVFRKLLNTLTKLKSENFSSVLILTAFLLVFYTLPFDIAYANLMM